ncbi:MAG: DNA-binding protein [Xanthomonadales bacterium]|nr:DNA-binding protein [Xanthomonadales bacterium]
MARGGVYRTDVEKARRALLDQGKNPTIDGVRAELGNTGSRTTIHRYLRELEAEEPPQTGTKVAVSDALQQLVQRLSEQLHAETDVVLAEQTATNALKLKEAEARTELAAKESGELRIALQRTEQHLVDESTKHAGTAAELQQARIQLAQLEERVAGHEKRAQEHDTQLQSLEEKHRHARDSLEHFRTSSKEQRDREHRQHEQALEALQGELRNAGDQLAAKNADLLQLNRDNGRLTEQLTQAQQTLKGLERDQYQLQQELSELRPLSSRMTALEEQAAKSIAEATALREQLDSERKRSRQLTQELSTAEIEKTRVAAKLEGMEAALAHQANPPARKGKQVTAKHDENTGQLQLEGSGSDVTT